MATMRDTIQAFFSRYPVDERGQKYFQESPHEVIQRVLAEFKPPREGESDYSGLLTSFVKRLRLQHNGGAAGTGGHPPAPAQNIDDFARMAQNFCKKYPVDDKAYDCLLSAPREVQMKVVQEFTPKREGENDYSALLMSFIKRCKATTQTTPAGGGGHWGGKGGGGHWGAPMKESAPPPAHRSFETQLQGFFRRYPVDDRAGDYFMQSSPEVQMRVVHEFQPKQEGERDYSSLFMSFVKRIRNEMTGQGGGMMQAPPRQRAQTALDLFFQRYPVDDRAHDFFASSPPEVQGRVIAEFRPAQEGQHDYSSLFMSFVKRVRNGAPPSQGQQVTHAPPRRFSPEQEFFNRYPVDDFARDYFLSSPPEVQARVLQEFKPKQEGEGNYSSLFMSFVKRCRSGAPATAQASGPTPLERFFQRYPIDERAYVYFTSSAPEVQARVIEEFQPPREGEQDYSGLFTSFVKRCRSGAPPASKSAALSVAAAHSVAPTKKASHELFFRRYPVDDRAYEYFASCSQEVQAMIVRDFQPKQEGESNYSSLFMSFVKRCRAGAPAGEAPVAQAFTSVQDFFRRYPVDDTAYGFFVSSSEDVQRRVMAEFRPPREGESDYSGLFVSFLKRCRRDTPHMQEQVGGSEGALERALATFVRRYPIDERAMDFLYTQSAAVVEHVVSAFAPKAEGQADYSALVMSFTKRCREQVQGSEGPAWKRARMGS
mmetsp:Transcript_4433/g.10767  ORF Transcript_4433/g.10767 Transcript_4433/m.10767 type:complete len:710 (-) Transcript_4433:39-2168(-)|eukprot:CAMPEP_0115220908 /NCGR_PEP_ID=MMETSP0270-20121206/27692_1 /TAXON_ID=71861 /ORGANISM="Scrippsiella trochoidea, Strain CCMP3099" /LENGTH=709 /DNA_ID=CAMNT_0002634983 /DNA_START=71 /DNA_END=2200 /DNA_ORIENTATION=+